ncbi:MAG TPA: hypothetical protein VD994_06985 [Prosthecobacter sp.]|nr:hypothetical protein [Prosthecobacter sp.]
MTFANKVQPSIPKVHDIRRLLVEPKLPQVPHFKNPQSVFITRQSSASL